MKKKKFLKENQTFIGVLNPYKNKEIMINLSKKKINFFSLELLQELQELNLWIYFPLRLILLAIKQS